MNPNLKKWLLQSAVVIASGIIAFLFARLTGETIILPPLVVQVEVPNNDPIFVGPENHVAADEPRPVYHTGWVNNPDVVAQVAAAEQFKVFSDTPAGRMGEALPDSVYLWKHYETLFARPPPSKNQNPIGSCVSFGTNTAIERTMAYEIAVLKKPLKFKFICEEVTYAGSRVEVGGGRISGDGSVGAWAAKFVKEWGVIAREPTADGKYDLTNYDPARCRKWGRDGVPDDLEPLAREHPVQSITQVKDWEEAKKALAQGYGIAICSNQGFSMQRDARGVCRPSGSWAHCMALDGYQVEGGSEYGHIENSWGANAHTGPVGWGNPPPSGFWTDSRTIDRMLKQGDSWAFSVVKGFPARKIVWPANVPPEQASDHGHRDKAGSCWAISKSLLLGRPQTEVAKIKGTQFERLDFGSRIVHEAAGTNTETSGKRSDARQREEVGSRYTDGESLRIFAEAEAAFNSTRQTRRRARNSRGSTRFSEVSRWQTVA